MKIVSMVCPNCGASIHVDADQKNLTCNYCGNSLYVDDEVKHIQYDNAEETGYQFEKGRQRAQAELFGVHQNATRMNPGQPPKRRKTWLWVLGWICIFPIPLTILMIRNQKLSKPVKTGIIAVAWIVYLLIGFSGGESKDNKNGSGDNTETSNVNIETTNDEQAMDELSANSGSNIEDVKDEDFDDGEAAMQLYLANSGAGADETTESIPESAIDKFIADINKSEDVNLEYKEDFIPSDENGDHYRTEFRLTAWRDSTGKSYKYGDAIVDIILSSSGSIQRIYMDGATFEQCESMIRYASPLLDSTVSASDIQETIDYVNEHKVANGYYYGKLGLLMFGHEDSGYEFMLN